MGCDSNVQSVFKRFRRQGPGVHEFLRKILRFLPYFQQQHVFQNFETLLRRPGSKRSHFG